MRPPKIRSFLTARNIVLLQTAALLVFFLVVRFSPDLTFSRVAERYIGTVAPWIYMEHFNQSVSSPVDANGQQGLAQAVYFESAAGAKVFSAGTIRWAWGVGKPEFTEDRFVRLNENLLSWFLATSPRQ